MASTSVNLSNTEASQPFIKSAKKPKILFSLFEEPSEENQHSQKLRPKWLLVALLFIFLVLFIIGLIVFLYLYPGCKSNKPTKWWQNEMIYQVEVSNFKDSNGDGIGDINGLTQKLDYINGLGAKSIIISRVNSRDTAKGVDSVYGDDDSLENLRRELDRRGMHLIIDLPISYLEDDEEDIVKHWLNNYADGIRVTQLNTNSHSSVMVELLAHMVNEISLEKFFGTDSEDEFPGEKIAVHKCFLELDQHNLSEPSTINAILTEVYHIDRNVWPSFMLGSFNAKRIRSLYNDNSSRLAHGLILLLKGTPIVLFGDEIELQGRSEIENTMQWDKTVGCGFTQNTDIGDFFQKSTNCQNAGSNELVNMYKDLSKLRQETSFAIGDIAILENEEVISFIREAANSDKYLVLVNSKSATLNLNYKSQLEEKDFPVTGSVAYSYSVNGENRPVNLVVSMDAIQMNSEEILVVKFAKESE